MKRIALLLPLAALLLAASPPAVTAPEEETEHIVQSGETLGGIASRARVPRVLIAEANGLKPPYAVRAGQKLIIPRTRHHVVKKGETGLTIAYNLAVPWRDIAVANGIDPGAPVQAGQRLLIPTIIEPAASPSPAPAAQAASTAPAGLAAARTDFRWPLSGTVRRGFSGRSQANYHDGIDIPAEAGTAVRAAAVGRVIFAGREPAQFGNMVVVDHGDGWHSAYAFLSRITVKDGDEISAGERVGLVGSTGRARGNELHFELRRNNRPIDPLTRLPERK
jgi:murein DD-endopeptidase MepM/ murein hydrolase activator NlpD